MIIATTHTLPLGAIPANLILFFILPWLMVGAGGVAIAAAISHSVGLVVAPLGFAVLWLMLEVVRICAALPVMNLPPAWFPKQAAIGTYALAWGLSSAPFERTMSTWKDQLGQMLARARFSNIQSHVQEAVHLALGRRAAGLSVPPAAALLLGLSAVALPAVAIAQTVDAPRGVRVTELDVGQGTATLVQAGSQRILIDGGPAGDGTVRALDRTLPPWQRSLSLVIVTERSADHVGGLPEVLQRYRVGAVQDATAAAASPAPPEAAWIDWQHAASSSHVARLPRQPETLITIGDGSIEVDAAHSTTGTRIAPVATVMLREGGRSLLLAGDPTASLNADVRRLPRGDLTPPPSPPAVLLLAPLQPGAGPPARLPSGFGHPLVYSTAANGDVRLDVSAGAITVRVQRGAPLGLFR